MKAPRLSAADALYIGLGGVLGSLLRTWIGSGYEGSFPVPTILVNILGAAALALLHASQHRLHPRGRYLYMAGFCGSFTTVSLFSLETVHLVDSGRIPEAAANLLIPVVVALTLANWLTRRFDRIPSAEAEG